MNAKDLRRAAAEMVGRNAAAWTQAAKKTKYLKVALRSQERPNSGTIPLWCNQHMTQADDELDDADLWLPDRVTIRVQNMLDIIANAEEGEACLAAKVVDVVARDIAAILPANISKDRIASLLDDARREIAPGDFRTIEDAAASAGLNALVQQALEWLVPQLVREIAARKRVS
jgi:hypothetical protein